MKHTVYKKDLQALYGAPPQSMADAVTSALRTLPENQPHMLPMRRFTAIAAAMLLVIAMTTGAVAMTVGWHTIQQWLGVAQLDTESVEEVLYETDQMRFILTEKTIVGDQLVLAVLHQPKAPGMLVLPMDGIIKSRTNFDNIMSLIIGQSLKYDGFAKEAMGLTLKQYVELNQLTPVVTQFMPTPTDKEGPVCAWQTSIQEDGSAMTYITLSPVDQSEPLKIMINIGSISHETMLNEYGYLSSKVEWGKHRQWITRTIDLPGIGNNVPQRLADPQTFTIGVYNTTVTISDLKLKQLPCKGDATFLTVQFHAEVSSAADADSIDITPVWPQIPNRILVGESPFKTYTTWTENEGTRQREYYYMDFGPYTELPDEFRLKIHIGKNAQTVTLPLKPME